MMTVVFTYPMLASGKITQKQYIQNCFKRNKGVKCQKQGNGYHPCEGCPKLEEVNG